MKTGTIGNLFTKTVTRIFIVLSASILALRCNPEAFVSHIEPSSRNFIASEDGDTIKVRFKTDNWSVFTIRVNDAVYCWTGDSSASAMTDDGKIKVSGDGFTMFYRKTGDYGLELLFLPNFSKSDHNVTVFVSNQFEEDSLTITQRHGIGYELERIEWNEPVVRTFPEFEKGWGPLSYKNVGSDTLQIKKKAFDGAARQITFSDNSWFGLYCGDFKVPVPDGALNNEELCFSKQSTVIYSFDTTEYPLDDDREVTMKFPPGGKFSWFYNILWNIDTYSTGYVLFLRNKATGGIVEVKGLFSSKSPSGSYTLYIEKP